MLFLYEFDVYSPISPYIFFFSKCLFVRSCYNLAFGEQTVRQVNLMSSSLMIQNNFWLCHPWVSYVLFDLRMTVGYTLMIEVNVLVFLLAFHHLCSEAMLEIISRSSHVLVAFLPLYRRYRVKWDPFSKVNRLMSFLSCMCTCFISKSFERFSCDFSYGVCAIRCCVNCSLFCIHTGKVFLRRT